MTEREWQAEAAKWRSLSRKHEAAETALRTRLEILGDTVVLAEESIDTIVVRVVDAIQDAKQGARTHG